MNLITKFIKTKEKLVPKIGLCVSSASLAGMVVLNSYSLMKSKNENLSEVTTKDILDSQTLLQRLNEGLQSNDNPQFYYCKASGQKSYPLVTTVAVGTGSATSIMPQIV